MKKRTITGIICAALIGLSGWTTSPTAAEEQDTELFFPENASQIEEFVLQHASSATVPKSTLLQPKGLKGIKDIVDDPNINEAKLDELPTVGAIILFETNSDKISANSFEILQQFADALQGEKLRDFSVVVLGHTDSVGDAAYNQKLSERRAQSVRQVLKDRFFISSSRLYVKAYGEEKPLKDNETPKGRAKNRRVEFKFYKKEQ